MARDDDDKYKAGVDFEWVTAKGSNYKTRKFFTKAEKEAMKAPKKESKPASKPASKSAAPTTSIRPKSKPVDAMKGYRKGDVTTSKITSAAVDGADKAKKTTKTTPTVDKEAQRTALKSVGPVGGRVSSSPESRLTLNRTDNRITKDTARASFDVDYDQWLKMTPAKRKELGLPATYGAIQRMLGTKMKTQTKNRFKFHNKED